MKKIAEDAKVIAVLYGKNSLIDSELLGFNIFRDSDSGNVITELNLKLHHDAELGVVLLRCINAKEISFFYRYDYDFGLVESFKLLQGEKGFYCALDPDSSTQDVSIEDQNFVFAESLELFELE